MDLELMMGLGRFGAAAALALAAVGSGLGAGAAGPAAVGAWKKAFAQGKTAPFILIAFVGAPLSQTIYGMILMNNILGLLNPANYLPADVVQSAQQAAEAAGLAAASWRAFLPADVMPQAMDALRMAASRWPAMISAGLFGGIAMGVSAWLQGVCGAAAADAQGETGKGFGNYLMALGIIETVALFVMVFVGASIR